MIRVVYDLDVYEGYAAARSENDIWVYDENWNEIYHISGIYGEEWNFISIQNGSWLDPSEVPTQEEILRQKVERLEQALAEAEGNIQTVTEQYETALAEAESNIQTVTEQYETVLEEFNSTHTVSGKLVGVISGQSALIGALTAPPVGEETEEEHPKLIGYLTIPSYYGERYYGTYEIIPTGGFQLLDTEEKYMEENVIVHPIPYVEVSNLSGGYTATIGG